MNSRVLFFFLISFTVSPLSVLSQSRPSLIFEKSVPKSVKNRIENYTSIFINEISKAGKYSTTPTFPSGIITDSCFNKITSLWENTRFIIYPFESAKIYNSFYGYEIQGVKIISPLNSGVIRSDIIFSSEGIISDFRLHHNDPIPKINKKLADREDIKFGSDIKLLNTPSLKKETLDFKKINLSISVGSRYLIENRTSGLLSKLAVSYNPSGNFFIGASGGYNIQRVRFTDAFGVNSTNRSYLAIQLYAGIHALESLNVRVGYERSLFDFSDNGVVLGLSYDLKKFFIETSIVHYPKYNFTLPEISVGFIIF